MNKQFTNYLRGLSEQEQRTAQEAVCEYLKSLSAKVEKITSSEDVYDMMRQTAAYTEEVLSVIFLNQANDVIGTEEIAHGGLNATAADIRVILREALLRNATSLIISHNHPSGNPTPSRQDIMLSESLRNACKTMELPLLDHVIVSERGYYSFADERITNK